MSEVLLSLAGRRALSARISAPRVGVWAAAVELEEEASLAGSVVLRLGGTELVGTVDADRSGTFNLSTQVRLIGGAAGWRKTVAARPYHNDAGLKRSKLLVDLARDAGEALSLPTTIDTYLGVDFLRQEAPASRILRQLIGPLPWWVSFDGTSAVAVARPRLEATSGVALLDYSPRHRSVFLSVDSAAAVVPGTVLRDRRLARPLELGDVLLEATGASVRARASVKELS